ncbi:hypothetical protein KY311_04400, partial [Candidatus Woesearchaeota archaeon]|nr:hypothetical protein [Candidatus Woesearchaeota archaeon]
MEMVDTEEEITEKLEGGNQNTTLLDRKGKKVIKKYTAKTPKKRLSQESTFLKFCPFAPKVLQKDTKNKRLDMAFIPNAKMSTVDILLKKKIIIDTARVLRITHKRKKFLQNELKEQKDAEKFDYVAVIKKYLSNISDKNFVERIKRDLHKFDILNDKKDYTLIHGDLWSNNILIKDGIYFIDAEHPETKNKYSIGNKYIDIAFFLGLALMKRGL